MTDHGPTGVTPPSGLRTGAWAFGYRARYLTRIGFAILGTGVIIGYYAVGADYYGSFWIAQGYGMNHLLQQELAHSAMFLVFGLVALACLFLAFDGITVTDEDINRVRRLVHSAGRGAFVGAVFVFLGTFVIARYVLGHAVISDDEHAYRFIAQTLRAGSLTAPSPGSDLEFFEEQFVILTKEIRYGKYPIGHPMLLAAGQILGIEHLVVPLITAVTAFPLFWLGTTLFGRTRASLALVLFASSPQVLLTGATLLSQPAGAFCLSAGLACLLAAERRTHGQLWLLAAGALFGFGILVRPLPGILFTFVAAGYLAIKHPPFSGHHPLGRWAAFLAPLLLSVGLMAFVNSAQSGGVLTTGYHAFHRPNVGVVTGTLGLVGGNLAVSAMSVAGNLLRLNFWLFGWPISLAFCAFARRNRTVSLLWAMIGAEWVYRLVAPKVGVGGTGPIYLFEVVPLLCLLTADGVGQLAASSRLGDSRQVTVRRLAALFLAAGLVSASMFLPVKLANLRIMGDAQLVLPRMIRDMRITNALVFHELAVPPRVGLSWAYFPRFNSPELNDDIIFVMFQRDASRLETNIEFWKRRFPKRTAWHFGWVEGKPALVDLEVYIRQTRLAATTLPASGGVSKLSQSRTDATP